MTKKRYCLCPKVNYRFYVPSRCSSVSTPSSRRSSRCGDSARPPPSADASPSGRAASSATPTFQPLGTAAVRSAPERSGSEDVPRSSAVSARTLPRPSADVRAEDRGLSTPIAGGGSDRAVPRSDGSRANPGVRPRSLAGRSSSGADLWACPRTVLVRFSVFNRIMLYR